MQQVTMANAKILIAADNVSDANIVKKLLEPEFERLIISTAPDHAAQDFDTHCPDVLVLAFSSKEKAEIYYLGLFRLSEKVHSHIHRTIILCHKDSVADIYTLCKKAYFDDYVLFWPLNHDATRLPMSIHHAMRELTNLKQGEPTAAEFAAQVRRIAKLEAALEQQMANGAQLIADANRAVEQAGQDIDVAIEGISHSLGHGKLSSFVEVKNAQQLAQELHRIKQEEVGKHLNSAAEAVQPLQQWSEDLKQAYTPYIESTRSLSAMAERVRPIVLVVDDDEFQRKTVGRILGAEDYQLLFADNGLAALSLLRRFRPDLIIMDVLMPEMDGIEVTRRVKAVPEFTGIPVIMVSGKSEGAVVMSSLKAGAANFLVKPFERDTLLAKVSKALYPDTPVRA